MKDPPLLPLNDRYCLVSPQVFETFEPEYELVKFPVRIMGVGNDGTYYAFGPSKPPFRILDIVDPEAQLLRAPNL